MRRSLSSLSVALALAVVAAFAIAPKHSKYFSTAAFDAGLGAYSEIFGFSAPAQPKTGVFEFFTKLDFKTPVPTPADLHITYIDSIVEPAPERRPFWARSPSSEEVDMAYAGHFIKPGFYLRV